MVYFRFFYTDHTFYRPEPYPIYFTVIMSKNESVMAKKTKMPNAPLPPPACFYLSNNDIKNIMDLYINIIHIISMKGEIILFPAIIIYLC